MKTKTKVGLILSLSLVVVGAGLAAVSLSSMGWSMENLFSDNRQLRVVGVDEPYSSVVVVTAVDGVKLDYSADNKESTVEVYYSDEYDYDIHVSEGTLYVTVKDDNRNISIDRAIRNGFSAHEVVLHLTGGEYSIVNLKTGLGNIDMEGDPFISKLYVETGIGDVDISKEAKIKDLDIKTGIGSVNVPASDNNMYIKTGIGNVHTPDLSGKKQGTVKIETGVGSTSTR